MDARQFLLDVILFENLATKRALDVLKSTKDLKYRFALESINYFTDFVQVILVEITRHDCPDYEYINLSIEQLQIPEDKWNELYPA